MTATRVGSNVLRDVEPHLPAVPTLWPDIAKAVDCWAPDSIRNALDELVKLGKAKRITIEDQRGFKRHLYSKVMS